MIIKDYYHPFNIWNDASLKSITAKSLNPGWKEPLTESEFDFEGSPNVDMMENAVAVQEMSKVTEVTGLVIVTEDVIRDLMIIIREEE